MTVKIVWTTKRALPELSDDLGPAIVIKHNTITADLSKPIDVAKTLDALQDTRDNLYYFEYRGLNHPTHRNVGEFLKYHTSKIESDEFCNFQDQLDSLQIRQRS